MHGTLWDAVPSNWRISHGWSISLTKISWRTWIYISSSNWVTRLKFRLSGVLYPASYVCEGRGAFSTYLAPLGVSGRGGVIVFFCLLKRMYSYLPACLPDSLGLREKSRSFLEAIVIHKAGQNRQLFDIFDNKLIDKHCQLSVVDWSIKVALSAGRCRCQVCYKWCRITDKRNITSLSV
jgi:hypothetical protein